MIDIASLKHGNAEDFIILIEENPVLTEEDAVSGTEEQAQLSFEGTARAIP